MKVTYQPLESVVETRMARKQQDYFYEGWLYHLLVDPALLRVRHLVRSQVNPGSTLIDFGCGTGELLISLVGWCSALAGVESSKRMWSYASKRVATGRYKNVEIIEGDGARLGHIAAGSFDYATASMVFHEMEEGRRLPVLREMQRLARTLILMDYRVPLPTNPAVRMCHLIERLAGRRHFRNFRSFLNTGGLPALCKEVGLGIQEKISFQKKCLHLVRAA